MPRVAAYQHGIQPRSETVVAATRDWDRGRTTWEAVDRAFDEDLRHLVERQRAAGMAYLSDGLLRWQDLFRPLVDAAEGMEAAHLTRWFDNNAFIRSPRVDGGPALEHAPALLVGQAESLPTPRVASLPSPCLFSRFADTNGERDVLMIDLARQVLRPVADGLAAQGFGLLHVEEPWLGFHGLDPDSWPAFEQAVGILTDGLDLPVVLHVYLGDASQFGDRLVQLPVHAIGIDAPATELDALGPRWPTGLLVGCLEGRNTLLEPVGHTVDAVARLAERLEPHTLYVSANTELELLPRQSAENKLARLGEIAAGLEERLS